MHTARYPKARRSPADPGDYAPGHEVTSWPGLSSTDGGDDARPRPSDMHAKPPDHELAHRVSSAVSSQPTVTMPA